MQRATSYISTSKSTPQSEENSRSQTPVGPSNPFATPQNSRPASTIGARSGFQYAEVPGTGYFRSRRVRKADSTPLPVKKKAKKEALLWLFPVGGLLLGLGLTALIIYLKITSITHHKYCPVLSEDFSSGALDPEVWTTEVQVGGYGLVLLL